LASNEGRVYFLLGGYNFDPDNITSLLGLEPTSVNRGGSGVDRPAISSWEFSTEKHTDDELDIFKMTNALIAQIEPVKDKLLTAIENHNLVPKIGVSLMLSVDVDEPAPEMGFGGRAIKFMAEIGALVDIDVRTH
jgi:hypothetical protein